MNGSRPGDIGNIDSDGYIFRSPDRKKKQHEDEWREADCSTQPIEAKLKANSLVSNGAMVGDGHKFACVPSRRT